MLRKRYFLYMILGICVILIVADYRWISTSYHPKQNGVPKLQTDSLTITRLPGIPDEQKSPTDYRVTDPQIIKQIYTLLSEQKPIEKERVYHCPADFGGDYIMQFEVDRTIKLTATEHASGCQFITLDNGTVLFSSESLRQLVYQTIGEGKSQLPVESLPTVTSHT